MPSAQDTTNTAIFPVVDKPPTFESVEEHRTWLLQNMAAAFRIFAKKGYGVGTAGHISVRDPGDPDTFWLNPLGRHFGTLKASDMVLVDHEGNVIGGSRLPVNKAGFQIHGAIHKARPDVGAACHTHSVYGKAYSAFAKPLDMINQDVCIFYKAHNVYKDFGGIVLDDSESLRIVEALGSCNSLILRNHGLLTAGRNVSEAAALFMLMEESCQAQLLVDASKYKAELVDDEVAKYTYEASAYPDAIYAEFIPELQKQIAEDPSFMD